jgi:hypothetical protein
MTPKEFCQLAMADYERQWTAAPGHQERHPLKVKMAALEQLMQQAKDPDEFGRLLAEGCDSDDPVLMLLCAELSPRWQECGARSQQSAVSN